jgi:hypothetical protein
VQVPESHLRWLLFALLSAVACAIVAQTNPVDRALPFIAVGIALCGWLIRETRWAVAMELAIPALIATALFVVDERTRVMIFGAIVAGVFVVAVFATARTFANDAVLTIAGTLLLRWIPFRDVVLWRELLVIAGALVVLVALRDRSPMNVAVALAVALVTPAFPARAMLYPFLLAAVLRVGQALLPVLSLLFLAFAWFDRYSHAALWIVAAIAVAIPILRRVRVPAYALAIGLFALWPWSGIVARAFPRFLFAAPAPARHESVGLALEAGESVSIEVPEHIQTIGVTTSGANVVRMRSGRIVGRIDAGNTHRDLRIGDIADFGFLRREQFFFSRNTAPRQPTDDIRGYGQTAWLHGAGRVTVPAAPQLRITAASDLPAEARLQIESVDFE